MQLFFKTCWGVFPAGFFIFGENWFFAFVLWQWGLWGDSLATFLLVIKKNKFSGQV